MRFGQTNGKSITKSLLLSGLIVMGFFVVTLSVLPYSTVSAQVNNIPQWIKNNAVWWGNSQISDSEFIKGMQYLVDNNILRISDQDEINKLKSENQNLQTQLKTENQKYNEASHTSQNLQSQLQQAQDRISVLQDNNLQQTLSNVKETLQKIQESSKPSTVISSGTVNWYFSDSMGNRYHWTLPIATYDAYVKYNTIENVPTYNLQLPNGQTVSTYDYSKLAKYLSERKEWSGVVDSLYDNAGSDDQFIYEVWHLVAEMTTYNKDITNNNLWPTEVFTRGEGDCKDKSILIADLLRSSSHTRNWDIKLEIMDMDNPNNPQTVNHMIVLVNTGQSNYAIEATATPDNNGLNVWAGKQIFGWSVPF